MTFKAASRIAGNHDVVLVGYRGIDGSARLDCPEVESALKRSKDFLDKSSFRAYTDGFRNCAARLQADGYDLAGYGLPQRVDDLETARKALGYGRIDLISESVGTRTAMIYAWRYPNSIHRSLMIGVNPPGHFIWYPKTTDEQIGRYARLCAQDASCSKRTHDLATTLKEAAADVPDRFWFLPIRTGNARTASFWGLMESTQEAAPLSAPMTLNAWISAAHGDASGLWFQSLLAKFAFPESFVWGDMASVARLDAQAAKRYFSLHADRGSIIGSPGSEFLFAGGGLLRAWPVNPTENAYTRVRDSNVETLLVGGELDLATPPQSAARELLPHLRNGRQLVLPGIGHTTSFWSEQKQASTRLLSTYFATGKLDRSLYKPGKVDFTPEVTQTALGKGFAGAMLGLPVIVLLSLLLIWRRSRRRGRFGRKASSVLRSVFTIVTGLGGWFAGVTIALVAFPRLPLDDALLAVISIGVPAGLGIYLAWVDRGQRKRYGLPWAAAGAIAGAWLGFGAATGLLAVITTIVGTALGGNLALLVLDIWAGEPTRSRIRETDATQTLEARPSIS
jgi:pimeloyl-ACP methyl ester carboxylesterase